MTNCFNMRCPKCGRTDQIDIHARVWIRLTDGTATDVARVAITNGKTTPQPVALLAAILAPAKSFKQADGGVA